jgi:hypothetical protein
MSTTDPNAQASVDELLVYNATLLERHKGLRTFRLFSDGTLEDPARRERLLACVQVFAKHFQTILHMRQAHCADERYRALFQQHLREEVGHDDILTKERGRSEAAWDPVMEGAGAWFISRMSMLDNIEKTAVMHLVLESSGAHMGSVTGPSMRKFGTANYFELHDEVDQSHVTMAIEPLRRQSAEAIAGVRVVVEQAWRVLDMWVERVATIVLGDEPLTFYSEPRSE